MQSGSFESRRIQAAFRVPTFATPTCCFSAPVSRVDEEEDLPALAEALRVPGPLIAVVRTLVAAVLTANRFGI